MFILTLMQDKYGFGYSDAEEGTVKVGVLQAKLSVMLESSLQKALLKKVHN